MCDGHAVALATDLVNRSRLCERTCGVLVDVNRVRGGPGNGVSGLGHRCRVANRSADGTGLIDVGRIGGNTVDLRSGRCVLLGDGRRVFVAGLVDIAFVFETFGLINVGIV